ncbi:ABC transporter permease [Azospirillum cavernae]|uniref:ABC transporter permease n=1 Tax=Azospirillum cavernae TaxID=2320860 RepID=A0A418W3W6_9PROT|nr:ABC transporter permease [Azospirillum cavernae]RJF84713.1 ABC transporter permease [Azospirillum cavernae]
MAVLTALRAAIASPRGAPSAAILALAVTAAIAAPWLAPYPYAEQNLAGAMMEPSAAHLLGTDEFGRDLLSRIIYGARVSLGVAVTAISLSVMIGLVLGAVAGYLGGWVDRVLMAIADVTWSFPEILIALVLIAILGPGLSSAGIAITIGYLAQFARLTRSQIIALKRETYVEAAISIGSGHVHVLARHLIPNALTPVIVAGMLAVGDAIILEATLGFFGLGAQPPLPSWGALMSSGVAQIYLAPWVILFPGLVIAVTVIAINLFGDALIDALAIRNRLKDR